MASPSKSPKPKQTKTRGGAPYDKVCRGDEHNYCFNLTDLVNQNGPLPFKSAVDKVVGKVESILDNVLKAQPTKELVIFEIAKTRAMKQKDKEFDRNNPKTWDISGSMVSNWSADYEKREFDGLVMFTATTDEIIADDIKDIMEHMNGELYAVELTQALIHHFRADEKLENRHGLGHLLEKTSAGVIYVAFKLGEKDGQTDLASKPGNGCADDINVVTKGIEQIVVKEEEK